MSNDNQSSDNVVFMNGDFEGDLTKLIENVRHQRGLTSTILVTEDDDGFVQVYSYSSTEEVLYLLDKATDGIVESNMVLEPYDD